MNNKISTVLAVTSELINSLKVTIKGTDFEESMILCLDDIINITYLDNGKICKLLGKIKQLKKDTILVDASIAFESKTEIIEVLNIREVKKVNHPIQPLA